MKSQIQAVALIAVFFCFLALSGYAVVPSTIHYQGRLLDNSGNPVEGITDVTFAIYDTPSGGTPLWSEVHEDLDVHRGFVIVQLGSENPVYRTLIDKTFSPYYLGIKINDDPEIVPRQEVESVPYALLSSGVAGDIHTDTAQLIIDGQPGFPPELTIKDYSSVTPTVDEYLRMTDLKISLFVDRGPGNVDWTTVEADKVVVWHPTGQIGSRLDANSLQLTSPDLVELPPLPQPGEPFFLIADDVFNQLFATMTQAGKLTVTDFSTGSIGELLPTELEFTSDNGATSGTRLSFGGLEVQGGSVQLLGGTDLTVTGTLDLSGGTLDLGSSGLTVGGNLDVSGSLTVDGGGTFSAGSSLVLYGTGSQTVTLSGSGADISYGDLEIAGSTTQSVYLSESGLKVRDVSIDHVDIGTGGSGAGGGFVDFSGSSGGGRIRINADGLKLTRPSLTDAFKISLDNPGTLAIADMDGDGLSDFALGSDLTSPYLHLEGSCRLRCDGTANFDDIEIGGMVTIVGAAELGNQLTVNGETICKSDWQCDADNDGTFDLSCSDTPSGPRLLVASGLDLACDGESRFSNRIEFDVNNDNTIDVSVVSSPSPELLVAAGSRFACDGLATFAQPTAVNSDLIVTGSLTVLGPKAFAQQHPEDPTKEVIYVALEGNESGTYTRGSAQLKNGVAEIQLPEDFQLVTNAEELTAQITPRGPVNSMLYVESVTPTTLVVKASNKKDANVKFDFMVNGVRSGFENHQVIRDKKALAINE